MTPPSNAGGEGREVLARIRARISEQGDMHITVSADETVALRQMLGVGWWEDQEESREIDAMALEMLCVAAERAHENADDRAPALVEAAVAEMRERAAAIADGAWAGAAAMVATGGGLSARARAAIADDIRVRIRALPNPLAGGVQCRLM